MSSQFQFFVRMFLKFENVCFVHVACAHPYIRFLFCAVKKWWRGHSSHSANDVRCWLKQQIYCTHEYGANQINGANLLKFISKRIKLNNVWAKLNFGKMTMTLCQADNKWQVVGIFNPHTWNAIIYFIYFYEWYRNFWTFL